MAIGKLCDRVLKSWRLHIWQASSIATTTLCALVWLVASTTSAAQAQVNVTERSYNPNRTGTNDSRNHSDTGQCPRLDEPISPSLRDES